MHVSLKTSLSIYLLVFILLKEIFYQFTDPELTDLGEVRGKNLDLRYVLRLCTRGPIKENRDGK